MHWGQTICLQSSEPGLCWGTDLEKAMEVFASHWCHYFKMEEAWTKQESFRSWTKKWATTLPRAKTWSRAHRSSDGATVSSSSETNTHEKSQEQLFGSSSVAQSDLWLERSSTSLWRDLIMVVSWWSRSLLTELSSTKLKGQNNYVTATCDFKLIFLKMILTEAVMFRCIAILDAAPVAMIRRLFVPRRCQ